MARLKETLRFFVFTVIAFCAVGSDGNAVLIASHSRPNVLLITVDDLNDWITLLDATAPIRTPNLKRLAERGVLFTHAYCASPACNPSRVATFTGLRPTDSGVYGNRSDWRRALPERKTLMQKFRESGYSVCGAGKIFHHHLNGAFHDPDSFDEFIPMAEPIYPPEKLNAAPEYGSPNTDWGAWPRRIEDSIDYHTVTYCVEVLERHAREQTSTQPLFLACGIFKPHSPFFAPQVYHDGVGVIPMPKRRADDWNDLPSGAKTLLKSTEWFWLGMMELESRKPDSYQDFLQAYAACAAFADAQVGRLLDALDANPKGAETIIVFWSDHGFHLGEKNHIEKFALWEKATHIPFIIVAPGLSKVGRTCDRPVDMTALFPTLLEICHLENEEMCSGTSIVPLLRDTDAPWRLPAVMTYLKGNHAVRSQHWRYIRYADQSEELYDHRLDQHEWKNLAGDERYAQVLAEHRSWLPVSEAPPIGDLKVKSSDTQLFYGKR